MKINKRKLGLGLLIVIIILVVTVLFFLGNVTKSAIKTVGPRLTKCDMTVEDVRIFPLTGFCQIDKLVIGNPEGYKTDYAISLDHFKLKFKFTSLFTDTFVIEEIIIKDPVIIYEMGLGNSNIKTIQENVEAAAGGKGTDKKEQSETADDKKKSGGKKVIIEHVSLSGASVKISTKVMQGIAAPIPLPPITLNDIGKESDGTSIGEAVSKIIGATLRSITGVVSGTGKLIGKGAGAAGNAALEGGKAVSGAATEGAKAVGGAAADGAKAVGGAAADGAKAVGGAASDGAKAVGGAAADGVKALGKGLGGALGGIKNAVSGGDSENTTNETTAIEN